MFELQTCDLESRGLHVCAQLNHKRLNVNGMRTLRPLDEANSRLDLAPQGVAAFKFRCRRLTLYDSDQFLIVYITLRHLRKSYLQQCLEQYLTDLGIYTCERTLPRGHNALIGVTQQAHRSPPRNDYALLAKPRLRSLGEMVDIPESEPVFRGRH